jgi:Rod binding domain-containing protein
MNTIANLASLAGTGQLDAAADADRKKQVGAARDFEALLIGQMLHSVRENGSSWLGTGEDDAGSTAFGFGEEQLAQALAKSGGLGLSKVIAGGLAAKDDSARKL